jgi:hypothetical protein
VIIKREMMSKPRPFFENFFQKLFNANPRMYLRKNDMDEPPRFDEDGDSENSGQRLKHHAKRYEDPLHLQVTNLFLLSESITDIKPATWMFL